MANFIVAQKEERDNIKSQLKYILSKHEGCANPIPARELSSILHKDERLVRLFIRELIAEGLPVASSTESPAGYFLVTNLYEAHKYSESIKGRLIEDALRRRDFIRSASLYLRQATQGRLI